MLSSILFSYMYPALLRAPFKTDKDCLPLSEGRG